VDRNRCVQYRPVACCNTVIVYIICYSTLVLMYINVRIDDKLQSCR
jgi:hypothetical protein